MKTRHVSNKSFIKNAKNFGYRVHTYISNLFPENNNGEIEKFLGKNIDTLMIQNDLNNHINKMIDTLILSYKRNPYRKMSAFVYRLPRLEYLDLNIYEIKVWYDFDYDNGKLIFKYSEKYHYQKFERKVQLVLKYSDKA